jgi:hypothetical protein
MASPLRTITITAYRRPDLFSRLLESLRANNLAGWQIAVAVEPTELAAKFLSIARSKLDGTDYRAEVNPRRLGIRENPFRLLERVFDAGSELNIYLEEDLLISPDVTQLSEWFAANLRPEWLCLSLLAGGCGSTGLVSDVAYPDMLFTAKTFNSIGFVLTRKQWYARLRPAWMRDHFICDLDGNETSGWDWSVFHMLIGTQGLYSLNPVAARSVHTGRLGGIHTKPDFHDRAFEGLPIFEDLAARPQYHVVDTGALPGPVLRHVQLWAEMTNALAALSAKHRAIVERRSLRGIGRKLAQYLATRARPALHRPRKT